MKLELKHIEEIYSKRRIEFKLNLSRDLKKEFVGNYIIVDYTCYGTNYRVSGILTNIKLEEEYKDHSESSYITSNSINVGKRLDFEILDASGDYRYITIRYEDLLNVWYGKDSASVELEVNCSDIAYQIESEGGPIC